MLILSVALLGFGLGASEGMTIVPMPFSALASVGCWGTSRAPLKFAGFGLERYLTIFFGKIGILVENNGIFR